MLFILKLLRVSKLAILLVMLYGTTAMGQNKGQVNEGVIELVDQMRAVEQSVRDLRGEVEVMRNEQNALKEELSQLKMQIQENGLKVAATGTTGNTSIIKQETNDQPKNPIQLLNNSETPSIAVISEEDTIKTEETSIIESDTKKSTEENEVATTLFNAAKDAFEQSLYDDSKEAFQSFLKTFSSEPRVFDANFYLAKIAEAQKAPKIAIAHLNSISVNAPAQHPLMPEVLFLLAKLYTQVGRTNDAKLVLDRLANEYPTSPESLKANLGRYD